MSRTEIEILGIGGHSKWLFTQLPILEEHRSQSPLFGNAATTGLSKKDSNSSGVRNDGSQRSAIKPPTKLTSAARIAPSVTINSRLTCGLKGSAAGSATTTFENRCRSRASEILASSSLRR